MAPWSFRSRLRQRCPMRPNSAVAAKRRSLKSRAALISRCKNCARRWPARRKFTEELKRMMNMAGKTVLITGSTDGVGRYVAAKLAAAGAHALIHGRDE